MIIGQLVLIWLHVSFAIGFFFVLLFSIFYFDWLLTRHELERIQISKLNWKIIYIFMVPISDTKIVWELD